MTDDQLLLMAARYRAAARFIQGFRYGRFHVIRDLRKPSSQQVIWREPVADGSDDGYRDRLDIEYMRFAVEGR
jgi:hypothetical protein